MDIRNFPFKGNYLESLPLNKVARYSENPPKNGIPFTGFPRQHPTEKNNIILVHDPLGEHPTVMEFKLDDVLYVEEVQQAVTKKGEGVPLVKLWVRKGARGMFLEPFEVNEYVHFMNSQKEQNNRSAQKQFTDLM